MLCSRCGKPLYSTGEIDLCYSCQANLRTANIITNNRAYTKASIDFTINITKK
jgi:tRNA(Ile2) C34 agmatinyltransferase TiaS